MDGKPIVAKINDSILNTVKKMLGIDFSYHVFDMDIIVGINSTFSTLYQLGITIEEDFAVMDERPKWSDIIKDEYRSRLAFIQQYVYLKVKVIFDPPTSSFVLDAYNKQISELEWRINIEAEDMRREDCNRYNDARLHTTLRRPRNEMGHP